jgi:hypothetical protein
MKLSVEALAAEIRKQGGNLAACARHFKVTRQAVYKYIKRYPSLKEVCEEADESCLDVAENALQKQIKKGNVKAICFYLSHKGQKRGYIKLKRIEHTGDVHHRHTIGERIDEYTAAFARLADRQSESGHQGNGDPEPLRPPTPLA